MADVQTPQLSGQEKVERTASRVYAYAVLAFLIAPLLIIVPLSFNAEPYFTFTSKMLSLNPDGYSLRWYRDIVDNPQWGEAIVNSLIIALASTTLATILGTLAAVGEGLQPRPHLGIAEAGDLAQVLARRGRRQVAV